jgi:hypothetical protein
MNYAELTTEQLDACMKEGDDATAKLILTMRGDPNYKGVDYLLVDTVTRAVFQSQCIAREAGYPPVEWLGAFLSTVATSIVQFNADTLGHKGLQRVAEGVHQVVSPFVALLADGCAQLIEQPVDKAKH